MFKKDLEEMEAEEMEEVVKRRKLGSYSMEADGVLRAHENLLKIIRHLLDEHALRHQQKSKK